MKDMVMKDMVMKDMVMKDRIMAYPKCVQQQFRMKTGELQIS
jgi:hypothetical protein